MNLLKDLLVRIRGDSSGFENAVDKAKNVAEKLGIGMVGAATAIAAAFTAITMKAVEYASRLKDTSVELGVATDKLAELQYAASQSGINAESFNQVLLIMQRNLANAVTEMGPALDAYHELGLSAKALSKETPDVVFKKIVTALGEVPNHAQKVALAFKIFGRQGGGIISLLDEGIDGINQLSKEADKLGVALSEVDTRTLEDVGDKAHKVETAFQGVSNTIAMEFYPILAGIYDQTAEAVSNSLPMIKDFSHGFVIAADVISGYMGKAFKLIGASIVFFISDSIASAAEYVNGFIKSTKAALNNLPFIHLDASVGVADDWVKAIRATATQAQKDMGDIWSAKANTDGWRKLGAEMKKHAEDTAKIAENNRASKQELQLSADARKKLADEAEREKKAMEEKLKKENEQRLELEKRTEEARRIAMGGPARALEDYVKAIRKAKEEGTDLEKVTVDALQGIEDAFVQLAMTGKFQMKDLFRSVAEDLVRLSVKQNITGPLAAVLQGAFQNMFGASSQPGTFFTPQELAAYGGARAGGGDVLSGKAYLVGENGPELMVPNGNGSIIPTDKTRSLMGSGGQNVVVNQTVQIGLGVQQTVRQELLSMMPTISGHAQMGVLTAIERGGPMARAVRRR